ncbi:MAG: FAD-dependent oxidoreductase [Pirellulales bacterium]|nr:FAD-dependent oxidoreductase [Pirellulales bacterium]
MKSKLYIPIIIAICLLLSSSSVGSSTVNQSQRQIPVACEVDVVVVGGSTGAVSAAVTAAEQGAKVFLAAPYPYLGEDMTATLQLWLEKGKSPNSPLAKAIYKGDKKAMSAADSPHPNRLKYSYRADQPSDAKHKDRDPPSLLCDGRWHNIFKDSVQYNDDVNLIFDLGRKQKIASFRLKCYGNVSGDNVYRVGKVDVFISDDGKNWTKLCSTTPSSQQIATSLTGTSADLNTKARYVKLFVRKHPSAKRILLGEVEIIGIGPAKVEKTKQAIPRPMHVKTVLDRALLDAGADFLYNSYATDIVRDSNGRACGIVMTNRAGRQAVLAKTIIDATDRARVARLAGAEFRPFPGGTQILKRVVIGGEVCKAPSMTSRTISPPFHGMHPNQARTSSGEFKVIEYTLRLPVAADTAADWAAADQQARSLTYHPEQQITADTFFQVPPDAMHGKIASQGEWQDVKSLPLESFQPRGLERLYVLGGCADISRRQAVALLRPIALMEMGARIGRAAAEEASKIAKPIGAHLPGKSGRKPAILGDIREFLGGIRPGQKLPTIEQETTTLPVLGRYDVVVIGGGTAGAPAGIGAARQGAKTLVVEYLCGLGGVGTTGYISRYCDGNRVGFTAEVEGGPAWIIERRMQWYREQLLKAGGHIWFSSTGCGALVDGDRVRGAVVNTPQGRGVVLANVVIDATGNADIAAAAGAQWRYMGEQEFIMQGTGLPPRQLGASYTNTDYTYVDETDLVDVRRAYIQAKERFADAFDLGQLVDTRERRSIVGEATFTVPDVMAQRTYPDTIVQARSAYDTHSGTIDTFMLLKHPFRTPFWANVPYRSLLPKGLKGILVSGIGLSAHRDAQPIVRMQADVQNQGYAAGVAAAMATKDNVPLRKINIRKLQRHLVEKGNLKKSVLTEVDSFPVPEDKVAEAVKNTHPPTRAGEMSQSLAIVLAHPQTALPYLRKAHAQSEGEKRLFYAKILGMLGDGTGLDTLLETLEKADSWDLTPHYMINQKFPNWHLVGWGVSNLDNTIMAIGHIGDRRAVPALVKKVKMLGPDPAPDPGVTYYSPLDYGFSHYRALAQAFSNLRDPRAAESLARVLARKDIRGYAQLELGKLVRNQTKSSKINPYRNHAQRELLLARALYLCGDHNGLGKKVLEEYSRDLRGHFARHAQAVLKTK